MNIAAVVGSWCAVSILFGIVFGQTVRDRRKEPAPTRPGPGQAEALPHPSAC